MVAVSFAPDFDVLAHPAARLVPLPPAKHALLFGRPVPPDPPPGRPLRPRVTEMDPAEVAGLRRLATAVLVTAARELNDVRADRASDARAFVFDVDRTPDLKFWLDLAMLDDFGAVETFRERCWRAVMTTTRVRAGRVAVRRHAASPTRTGTCD